MAAKKNPTAGMSEEGRALCSALQSLRADYVGSYAVIGIEKNDTQIEEYLAEILQEVMETHGNIQMRKAIGQFSVSAEASIEEEDD